MYGCYPLVPIQLRPSTSVDLLQAAEILCWTFVNSWTECFCYGLRFTAPSDASNKHIQYKPQRKGLDMPPDVIKHQRHPQFTLKKRNAICMRATYNIAANECETEARKNTQPLRLASYYLSIATFRY